MIDAHAWRRRVDRELVAAADPLPEVRPFEADPSIRVSLSPWLVDQVLRCGVDALVDPEPFAWSPAVAAHRLAVAALVELTEDPRTTPPAAVATVLDRLAAGTDEFGRWLAELSPAARVVVQRHAGARAVAMRSHLSWPLRAELNPAPVKYRLVARPVELTARIDLVERRGGRPATVGLLQPGAPGPHPVHAAAHAALVMTLSRGIAPERVVQLWPAAGERWATAVDEQLLDRALERIVDAASVVVGHRTGVTPEPSAGSWCAWCRHRTTCATGHQWLIRPGRRLAGLLPDP